MDGQTDGQTNKNFSSYRDHPLRGDLKTQKGNNEDTNRLNINVHLKNTKNGHSNHFTTKYHKTISFSLGSGVSGDSKEANIL